MATGIRSVGFSRERLTSLLDDVDAASSPEALTVGLAPGASPDDIASELGCRQEWPEETLAAMSKTGCFLFLSRDLRLLVVPPFPVTGAHRSAGFDTGPLRAALRREVTFGVVLLRLGGYAVGVFKGDRLVASKSGTRYVKGRHKAGGTSQSRFARIRQKQIHELFVKVCSVAQERLGPYEGELERVFLGGEGHTLTAFLKECAFLRGMKGRIAGRLLAVREPRRRELERMPRQIWMSRVLALKAPEGFLPGVEGAA